MAQALRSVGAFRAVVAVAILLAAAVYALGGSAPTEPLPERIAHCLDDTFDGVSLDPAYQGQVGTSADAGAVEAEDDQGHEVDLGVEHSAGEARRFADSLRPLKVERVGSVVFAYNGDSPAEREYAARCATGRHGTESLIEPR